MRRFIPLALAATMALGNLAFSAAEKVEPVVTDMAGDANFLNGQGSVTGAGDHAGGMSDGGADLLSFSVIAGKKTQLRIAVGDFEPTTGILVRVRTTFGDCAVWFEIFSADLGGGARLPSACGESAAATYTTGITISQDKDTTEYVMELDFAKLAPELKPILKAGAAGTGVILATTVRTATPAATLTAPTYDDAYYPDATFKI